MKKYEYDMVESETLDWEWGKKGDFDDDRFRQLLNQKGREGWDLISCFTTTYRGYTCHIVAVLKREIET